MLEKAAETIAKYNMAEKSESLLCCLSGGADSVALLLSLTELGYKVRACHINHQLRGEESDRDERFCVDLCGRLGVPIEVHRIDVHAYCAEHGVSVEQGARELRYGIFAECGCDKIATAHTLSDCIETAVFNLARGTGLTGLASVPPVRDNVIRPLIECSRAEIEAFLNERGQTWVTDSTNLTDEYTRNRIRHGIVPKLREINPSLEKTMAGTLENLREDNALIRRLTDELYERISRDGGLDAVELLSADRALSGRAIRRLLGENGAECSRETALRVRQLCEKGGRLTLGYGRYAALRNGLLVVEREREEIPDTELTAAIGGEICFLGKNIRLTLENDCIVQKKLTNFCADYDKIKGVIVIRNKRNGDRLRLCGRNFTSEVKKLLQAKFSPEERRRAVILCDSEGVIFVEGYGFAERVKADQTTKTVLLCKIS
ncbi:tRNA(Ile)-lysidine synthase [Ruminococcus sp. YE71]|uniref:tRNA lysidine(34) synthetase TilS n=1 Tax=unclassified Ruminococcus TaxID=2608920 RepID=UPI00088AF74A|nr:MULTISPECIES: tRNA lysidine(34) synthetase TilS [unclassified Ruminococcus]SDA16936.1 tRNA(Ile)-lysidine synthase [Ruminococcus sp. YE78]SFW25830.1 tRNA(Ile)-lysidine synthase [Ruminococcus sp. YE71]